MEGKYIQSSRSAKSNSHRHNPATSTRALKDIPRVQIFLDSQLKKAITKIQQESNKKAYKQPNSRQHSYQPTEQSIKLQSSRKQSQSISVEPQKTVTFMPNDVVLTYIKEVYQKYGIKNPFEGYLDQSSDQKTIPEFAFQKYPSFSDRKQAQNAQIEVYQSIKTHKKQHKISQNQTRIFQLKNKFKQTIQNQPFIQENTMKKTIKNFGDMVQPSSEQNSVSEIGFIKKSQGNITYIQRLTHLMESQVNDTYDFENDSTFNKTPNEQTPERSLKHINKFYEETSHEGGSPQVVKPNKKLFVKTRTTSTKYNQKPSTPEKSTKQRVTFKTFEIGTGQDNENQRSQRSTSIIKIEQATSVVTSQFYQNSRFNQLIRNQEQIPQVYRYCLGCETAILDSNVAFHQKNCVELKRIAQISINELYQIVDSKIIRLKTEISQSDLMKLELKDVEEIRSHASKILVEQDMQKMDQRMGNGQVSRNFREDFMKVNLLLSRKLLVGCQMIKKLEWFSKVRENLYKNHIDGKNLAQTNISKWQTN